jgi:hypothetical protein
MLSLDDRRWLEQSAGPLGHRHQQRLLFAAVFLAMLGTVNLGVAVWVSHLGGYQAAQLAQAWITDIQVHQQYSGFYVKALERLNLGLVQLGVALFFAFKGRHVGVERRRQQRLIEAFQECGAW